MNKTASLRQVATLLGFMLFSTAGLSDTLSDIYETALENDPVLRAAEATYNAGMESRILGRAALLPQISATGSYGESDFDSNSQSVFVFENLETHQITVLDSFSDDSTDDETENYSISLFQNIINMPAWFSFKQGKELSLQAGAQFGADQQDLIIRVSEAYLNVLRELDNLASSKSEAAAFKRQYEQTQQRFEVGLIAITDVHEAKAGYDLAVVQRLTDAGNLGIAYEALAVLTGRTHSNLWLLSEEYPIVDPEPAERSEWVEFSLKNNYTLRARGYAAEAARQQANAAKSEHYPILTGSVDVFDNENKGSSFDNELKINKPFGRNRDGYFWNLRLDVPLYSGGGVSAARRQTYEQYIAARETHTSTLRNAIQATRSLHLAVVTDAQRVSARRQVIVSAQSALDATTAGYEVGTRNVVDVLQAQGILFNALRDYANTRYDYVFNKLRLLQAAGLLGPQHIVELNAWLVAPPPPSASTK